MNKETEVRVPDIGDFIDVEIIEVHVAPGDSVTVEDPLITLESDKATMDVPSPHAGLVKDLKVKLGDRVSEGSPIVLLEPSPTEEPHREQAQSRAATIEETHPPEADNKPSPSAPEITQAHAPPPTLPPPVERAGEAIPHASPSVRSIARDLGVDLSRVKGSGPKGRILKQDVQEFVRRTVAHRAATEPLTTTPFALPSMPAIDFSQFGEIETKPLSRIKKLSGANVHRNWAAIPHVTQHDRADITELEAFRRELKEESRSKGIRLTPLVFLMQACVAALKQYPEFNASLDPTGERLVLKKYFHIGIAVDTPEGLVVPVIRDVDQKGIYELAGELSEVSDRARNRRLSPSDMQGGSFSISSLGGIGGSAFTPIVNAPEVAILGVSRARMAPVYENGEFVPRLILPLSLSYDHRVIDGAQAVRFTTFLCEVLSDIRRLLL